MSFAAIHLPEFPIAAWLLDEAELKTQPLVLLDGIPPLETVASFNASAQALHIVHGMTKAQAETTCLAYFRARDPKQELRAFEGILQAVDKFTPRVEPVASPKNGYAGQHRLAVELLLDSSGTSSLFGTPKGYARNLRDALLLHGFEANVAVAPNAEAALMFARGPNKITCVEQGDLRRHLQALSIARLPCAAKTHALLRRWGIRTLAQLAALPDDGLVSRLGQEGRRLQELARGEAQHLLTPLAGKLTLADSVDLESPLFDMERLLFALSRLLNNVLRKAVEHAYAARSLTVILTLDHGRTHIVHAAPTVATQSRDLLLKLLKLELEANPPSAGVIAVGLEAEPAQPQVAQRGLFQSQFPAPDRLDLLLARLQSIAGSDSVGSPELANSHADDAFTIIPFRPEQVDSSIPDDSVLRLALRRLRPPQLVRVRLKDERPHLLFWRDQRLRIASTAGPWHVAGSWWDKSRFDYDFWDVVTEEPLCVLRLRQQHAPGTWVIVGLYD